MHVPEERAQKLVSEIEAELRPLTVAASLAAWDSSTADTPATQERAVATEANLRKYLGSRARYEQIEELLSSEELRDPLLRRQLQRLALEHRPNLLPDSTIDDLVRRGKEIQSEFFSFRARMDGREVTNNEIVHILRTEADDLSRHF